MNKEEHNFTGIEPLDFTPYFNKANDVMRVLQEPRPMRLVDYNIVLGLVLKRACEEYSQNKEEQERIANTMCKSIRLLLLGKKCRKR